MGEGGSKEKKEKAINVISTPMGEALYVRHGFKELRRMIVQVKGDDQSLAFASMVWNSKKEMN